MIYVFLQILLILFIYVFEEYIGIVVSLFIVLFLFFISLERISLQFKSRKMQESKDAAEREHYQLRIENKSLLDKNLDLIEKVESIGSEILGKTKILKQKR